LFGHERFRSLWAHIAAVVGASCSEDARIGQLVVTIQTDMAMPDQIDNVNVQVTRNTGSISYKQDFEVGAQMGDYRVPGTISLYPEDGFEGPVTVRVMGRRQNVWRTYREAVISIPNDRVAELRMPVLV
jgi:hypothetical protein